MDRASAAAQPARAAESIALADMVLAGPLLPAPSPAADGLADPSVDAARPIRAQDFHAGADGAFLGRFVFHGRRRFYWKVALLAATTIALVPILLWRSEQAAVAYLVALVAVHLGGAVIVLVGVRRHDIAPDTRGLVIRLVGIAAIVGLLYLASQGLKSSASSGVFWWALFAIWALHTLGLALLHVRGKREQSFCPFV